MLCASPSSLKAERRTQSTPRPSCLFHPSAFYLVLLSEVTQISRAKLLNNREDGLRNISALSQNSGEPWMHVRWSPTAEGTEGWRWEVGGGGDWPWGQRMLIHLTLFPTSQSWAHSQSGGWGWRHNKPSLGLSPTFLRKMRKEFAEAEGQDLVISMSFLPWEGMLDLDTIKCMMSILKWLLWGWRVATIYTRRQVFPSSSVFIHSLDLRGSTYQRTSQSDPLGNVCMAHSS